jgi:acetyltransferase-like isoleucine patch superfamily enzyme
MLKKLLPKIGRFAARNASQKVAERELRRQGVQFDLPITLYGTPIVSMTERSAVRLGERVILCSDSRFTALGVNHPVVLRTLLPGAEIILGDDVGISGGSLCASVSITVGDGTMFGANVTVADTDFHPVIHPRRRYAPLAEADHAPVRIGRNVFIGTNTIVLKGVTIGDHAVIGAGSVVTRDIPARAIAAGNPCRVLRTDAVPENL